MNECSLFVNLNPEIVEYEGRFPESITAGTIGQYGHQQHADVGHPHCTTGDMGNT